MSRDEAPLSTHVADQAWFSMLLVNDPNTALAASLRPSREHPLWAALRRPFERGVPLELGSNEGAEDMPGLRPRAGRWLGAGLLLALGVGLAWAGPERVERSASEAFATFQGAPLASAAIPARPALARPPAPRLASSRTEPSHGALAAPAPLPALAITASVAPTTGARAQAPEGAPAGPRASTAAVRAAPAKKQKQPAARSLRRELDRALTKRNSPR